MTHLELTVHPRDYLGLWHNYKDSGRLARSCPQLLLSHI